MIKRILSVTAILALSACATNSTGISRLGNNLPADPMVRATPQPALLSAKDRLVGAMESNGCALTVDNAGAVLTQATISKSEMQPLILQLQSEGRVDVAGDGAIRLTSDRCI